MHITKKLFVTVVSRGRLWKTHVCVFYVMCEIWGNGKKRHEMNLTGLGWGAMVGLVNTPMNI